MLATRLRGIAAVAVALSLLAGCAGAPSAAPSASQPEPTAHQTAASPPVVDILAAFMETINDPAFTVAGSLSGSLRLGELEIAVSGEIRMRGADSYMRILAEAPGLASSEFESLRLANEAYERIDGGLWMRQAPGAPSTGGLVAGFDFVSLRQAGTRSLEDATYHVLVPVGGTAMTPATLGFDDPTIDAFDGSVEFLADDAGQPIALAVEGTWIQTFAEEVVDASYEMTFRFGRVGQWVSIQKPAQAWQAWSSDRLAYSVSYPSTWEASPMAATESFREYDLFLGPIDEEVDIYRYTDLPSDTTRGMWYQWEVEWIVDTYDVQPQHWQDLLVGDLPARQFMVHFTADDGGKMLLMDVIVVGEDSLWNICWYSAAGSEEADRSLFETFLSTFRPGA